MRSTMNASDQAAQWALKKKEMMDKANRIKEERKQNNLATMGEMALGGKTSYEPITEKPRSSHSQQRQQQQQQQQQQPYSQTNPNYRQQFKGDSLDFQQQSNNRQYSAGRQIAQQQQPSAQVKQQRMPQQPQSRQQQQQQQQQQIQTQNRQQQQFQQKPPSQNGMRSTIPRPQPQQSQSYQQNIPQSTKISTQSTRKPQQQIPMRQAPREYEDAFDNLPIRQDNKPQINQDQGPEQLYQCSKGCGRSFARQALQKHEKICVKVFQQQRKQFNTQKQRIISNEQASHLKNQKVIENKYEKALSKKPDWKKQSEAFRAIVKAAKGGKISQAQQNLIKEQSTSSLVPCKTCGRKFNEDAAKKHIPFCEKKAREMMQRVPQKNNNQRKYK